MSPADLGAETLLACAATACASGDCASILVPASITANSVLALQSHNLAVIVRDCEPRMIHHLKADGIHIARAAPVKPLRAAFKTESIGVFAAASRHIAMEAADAGADYIAFAQKSQDQGEPLLAWWHDVADLPAVAFDPAGPEDLATLLPQNPDFIRPLDAMWESPDRAREIISTLTKRMT